MDFFGPHSADDFEIICGHCHQTESDEPCQNPL